MDDNDNTKAIALLALFGYLILLLGGAIIYAIVELLVG